MVGPNRSASNEGSANNHNNCAHARTVCACMRVCVCVHECVHMHGVSLCVYYVAGRVAVHVHTPHLTLQLPKDSGSKFCCFAGHQDISACHPPVCGCSCVWRGGAGDRSEGRRERRGRGETASDA